MNIENLGRAVTSDISEILRGKVWNQVRAFEILAEIRRDREFQGRKVFIWTIAELDSPDVILAKILQSKGKAVLFEDFLLENQIKIFGDSEAFEINTQVITTPEFRAIRRTFGQGFPDLLVEPDVKFLPWDESTKLRLSAAFWRKVSEGPKWQVLSKGRPVNLEITLAQKRIEETAHTTPLTTDEISVILESVVDRVLAQFPKPS